MKIVIQGIDRALSVSEMTTPTLMIAGAADSLCAANVMDWQSLPNARLHVFSRVGHGVPTDVPDEFADVVRDFIVHGVVNAATLVGNRRTRRTVIGK
jgi:pimeloyl-ACP methyl ester carboxylesterase